MAEGSWWSNWVTSAKTKGAEVLEFVKKDINEISTVVRNEASVIANNAAVVVKDSLQLDKEDSTANSVKKSLSSFFDQISDVFVPPSEDDQVYVPVVVKDGEPVQLSPFQMRFYQMISSEETYTTPIEPELEERFNAWLGVSEEHLTNVERLTNCLASNPILQDKYTLLVPEKVSHSEFWKRYLFRRAVLEDGEAERARKHRLEEEKKTEEEIVDKANTENEDDKPLKEIEDLKTEAEKFPWDKEKDFGPDIELTEEEQTRLLAQYDAEIKAIRSEKLKENNEDIKIREKSDMVIVGSNVTSQASTTSSKESSTDGDWEKEFEIEEEKN